MPTKKRRSSRNGVPSGMTGKELIDLIRDNNAENKVIMFTYDYGDHWHSQVCESVDSGDFEKVEYSDYHNKFKLPSNEEDRDIMDPDDPHIAFVLKA